MRGRPAHRNTRVSRPSNLSIQGTEAGGWWQVQDQPGIQESEVTLGYRMGCRPLKLSRETLFQTNSLQNKTTKQLLSETEAVENGTACYTVGFLGTEFGWS